MLRRSFLSLSLLCASAAPMAAQEAAVPILDDIFDLPNVQSVEIDSGNGEFFAVSENRLMRWRLDPLELASSVEIDTLASDLALSPRGTLYLAGQRWDPTEVRLLGGSIIGVNIDRQSDKLAWSRIYRVASAATGIAQFSSIAFDTAGRVYFASPVVFSVQVLPDDLGKISRGISPGFELRCGASTQFSVFSARGATYYVSSTRDGALLEYGYLETATRRPVSGECFRVANVFAEKQTIGTYNAVAHAIIETPDPKDGSASTTSILALEPNNGRLYLFPIDVVGGEVRLSRARSSEVDLTEVAPDTGRPVTYRLLKASADGSEIYVSSPSTNAVLRFALADGRLRYRGHFQMDRPVQNVEVSADGRYAAIVSGNNAFNARQQITIIRDPAAIPDQAPLPRARSAVETLQRLLNDAGFDAGTVDGIFGPRTGAAIDSFLKSAEGAGHLGASRSIIIGSSVENGEAPDQESSLLSTINSVFPSGPEL